MSDTQESDPRRSLFWQALKPAQKNRLIKAVGDFMCAIGDSEAQWEKSRAELDAVRPPQANDNPGAKAPAGQEKGDVMLGMFDMLEALTQNTRMKAELYALTYEILGLTPPPDTALSGRIAGLNDRQNAALVDFARLHAAHETDGNSPDGKRFTRILTVMEAADAEYQERTAPQRSR